MARRLRRLSACLYGVLAVVALVRPAVVLGLFGGATPTPQARNEIRAVYGGFSLAVALVAWRSDPARPEDAGRLRTAALASLGMAGARLAGMVVERRVAMWPTGFFLVLEVFHALALWPRRRS